MKKGIFLLGMLCLSIVALGYQEPGALPRMANSFAPLNNYLQGTNSEVNPSYLLPKMIQGQPLRIDLSVRGKEPYEPEFPIEKIKEIIEDSYKKWFEETALWIRQQKREEEFADVLAILDRGVSVVFAAENPDIRFSIKPLEEIQAQCGAYGYYKQAPGHVTEIWLAGDVLPQKEVADANRNSIRFFKKLAESEESRMNFYMKTAMHEIGHSIGFSDMYAEGHLNSDQIYGSAKYSSQEKGIMDGIDFKSILQEPHLSCDDATGIINLIDITRGYTQRGGEKGWKSLCPRSKEYFIHNVSGLKDSYRVQLTEGQKVIIGAPQRGVKLKEYHLAREMISPFEQLGLDNLVKDRTEKDALGRPVHGEIADGNEFFINYLYERRILAIVNDNSEVLFFREDEDTKNGHKTTWLFNHNGEMNNLTLLRNKEGISLSLNKGPIKENYEWIEITGRVRQEYDKKGNRTHLNENARQGIRLPANEGQTYRMTQRIQDKALRAKQENFDQQLDLLVKRWIAEKR